MTKVAKCRRFFPNFLDHADFISEILSNPPLPYFPDQEITADLGDDWGRIWSDGVRKRRGGGRD